MKQFGGWHFPDHEEHLIEWMKKTNDIAEGRQRYQGKKQDATLKWCKQFRTAVDVGAHVGLWSYYLARQFNVLHAFEPVKAHRECWLANMPEHEKSPLTIQLHACALGERDGSIAMHTSTGSSGDSWVDGAGDIPMKRLDEFNLQDVDFVKIDTEGHELFVLRGAEDTIKRCRPCMVIEQKPGHGKNFGIGDTDAIPLLEGWGAKVRKVLSGDYIVSFDDAA